MLGLAGAAIAEEPAPSPDKKSCFFTSQISGWNKVDSKTVRVSVGPGKQYDLTLSTSPSSNLDQENLAIKGDPSGQICTGNGLGVSVIAGGIGIRNIPVTKVALAPTKAEQKAIDEQEKAKPLTDAPPNPG